MNPSADGIAVTDPERTLATIRIVVVALAASPLLALGVVPLLPAPSPSRVLVAPAALGGIVALAAAYRLYHAIPGRSAPGAACGARLNALRTGTIASLAVTEATALFGVIAFHFSREPLALVGLATHLILAGAVWPTRARLESMERGPADSAPGAEDP